MVPAPVDCAAPVLMQKIVTLLATSMPHELFADIGRAFVTTQLALSPAQHSIVADPRL
jgi:hypothetical protein